jgi:hypothetical protein
MKPGGRIPRATRPNQFEHHDQPVQNGDVTRLLDAFISALSAVSAVALGGVAVWLNAFGPEFLANGWSGTALQLGFWFGALAIVVFGSARHLGHWVELVGSFFALFLAIMWIQSAIDTSVLAERGQTTSCTVLRVHERVERHTDPDGRDTGSSVYYDHTLKCDTGKVRAMTTGDPAGAPGQRITVRYDPKQRLDPRLADEATTPKYPLRNALIALVLAALLRGVSELRGESTWSADGFVRWFTGLERVRLGVTIFVVGLTWLFAFFAALHALGSMRDQLLAWFGISQAMRHGWLRWLVNIPSLIVIASVFRYMASMGSKLFVRLLGAARFLDPRGDIQGLLSVLDPGFEFSIGGISLSPGGGVPGIATVKKLMARRSTRRQKQTP